jgi:hypothetical protein
MGYNTRVTGEITITPPIPWHEVESGPFTGTGREHRDVNLRLREEIVRVDGDRLVRRTADAVVPAFEDSYRAYDVVPHLQELIDAYGAGREFAGRLEGEGEDSLDVWRLVVRDGRAVLVTPVITWPDEDGPS